MFSYKADFWSSKVTVLYDLQNMSVQFLCITKLLKKQVVLLLPFFCCVFVHITVDVLMLDDYHFS